MRNDTERLDFVLSNPDLRLAQSEVYRDWSIHSLTTGETFAADHDTARAAIDEAIDAASKGEQAAEKGGAEDIDGDAAVAAYYGL